MRRLFPLLALCVAVLAILPLGGCCAGQPTLTLRNPFLVDSEPASIAGSRMIAMPPQYASPTYSVQQYGCAPALPGYAITQPTYAPSYGYAANPCLPGTTVVTPGK